MTRTPSSKAAWASGLVFGSATGAIGFTGAAPGAGALCAQPASTSAVANPAMTRDLLVTTDLLDAVQGHARLSGARRQTQLGLFGIFILGQPRQGLPDRLGVLVVDADLQRAR